LEAAMTEASFPVRLVRGVPVVAAPVQVEAGDAARLWSALAAWIRNGHATFVIDLSHTQRFDKAGLAALNRLHRRVLAEGGGLRLVYGRPSALPAGLDRTAELFASVVEAVSELPAAVIPAI
jgi:anti-anti-sigma regulatory factor